MLVTGIEDDYVVGGELTYSDYQEAVEFESLGSPKLQQWLKDTEWEGYVKELGEKVLNFR